MVDAMRIGFVGLGNMGAGMAANLLAAGHEVTAYNRSPEKVAALVERGAKGVSTVRAERARYLSTARRSAPA